MEEETKQKRAKDLIHGESVVLSEGGYLVVKSVKECEIPFRVKIDYIDSSRISYMMGFLMVTVITKE